METKDLEILLKITEIEIQLIYWVGWEAEESEPEEEKDEGQMDPGLDQHELLLSDRTKFLLKSKKPVRSMRSARSSLGQPSVSTVNWP